MRPRRQALQVSTFPFLAVLLCAMGSLILLLLVIDRRAKTVARAKAMQLVERRAAEEKDTAERRRTDIEKRRLLLDTHYRTQIAGLLERIQSMKTQATTVVQEVQTEKTRRAESQKQIERLAQQIEEKKAAVKTHEAGIKNSSSESQKTRDELERMTGELLQMERALAELKTARTNEKPTYSLLPYRGKHGDNRRPFYVECTTIGLVIQPDGRDVQVASLRSEIERRVEERRAASPATDETPYVLFLVRPAGITNYYEAIKALNGTKVDFGYEFVETEWVFDFSERTDIPAPSATTVSKSKTVTSDTSTQRLGVDARSSASGGSVAAPPGPAMVDPQGWTPRAAGANLGRPRVGAIAGSASSGSSPLSAHATNQASSAGSLMFGNASGAPSAIGADGNQSDGPLMLPVTSTNSSGGSGILAPSSPHQMPSEGPLMIGGQAGVPSPNTRAGAGNASSDAPAQTPAIGPQMMPATTAATGQGPAHASNPGANATTAKSTERNPIASTASSTSPQAQPTGSAGTAPTGTVHRPGTTEPNNSGSASVATPSHLGALGVGSDEKRPAGRLLPSRDWHIIVECTKDGVVIFPGGIKIPISTGADRTLPQVVEQMIVRRKSMARPGEAPDRAVIQFRVRPDGLHTYYLAYPALEPLRVPMTRENLRAEGGQRQNVGAP